jgi:hypothetical protein
MALVHSFVMGLGGGNAIYAAKAGVLTSKANPCLIVVCQDVELFSVLLCLPSFLKSSAQFAYGNYLVLLFFNVSQS